ncbi:MAG: hypothetical protein MPJ22_00595 [Pirellulales bacterium]|nr:hypothetical protein [Pirellulales bacterium]
MSQRRHKRMGKYVHGSEIPKAERKHGFKGFRIRANTQSLREYGRVGDSKRILTLKPVDGGAPELLTTGPFGTLNDDDIKDANDTIEHLGFPEYSVPDIREIQNYSLAKQTYDEISHVWDAWLVNIPELAFFECIAGALRYAFPLSTAPKSHFEWGGATLNLALPGYKMPRGSKSRKGMIQGLIRILQNVDDAEITGSVDPDLDPNPAEISAPLSRAHPALGKYKNSRMEDLRTAVASYRLEHAHAIFFALQLYANL